jgi:F-type H+-transporting ATPase subunit b
MSMRKLVLLVALAGPLLAAAPAARHEGAARQEEAGENLVAKWINFAILAGGLAYVSVKSGGPAFRAQKREILANLNAAAERAEEAAREAQAIDARMAGLQAEVAALRTQASHEMTAEAERIRQETARQIEKLNAAAQLEIASAVKHAQQQLRAQAAELAIGLAAKKIAARLDERTQAELVDRFMRNVSQN